jgi:hypothetical protein
MVDSMRVSFFTEDGKMVINCRAADFLKKTNKTRRGRHQSET